MGPCPKCNNYGCNGKCSYLKHSRGSHSDYFEDNEPCNCQEEIKILNNDVGFYGWLKNRYEAPMNLRNEKIVELANLFATELYKQGVKDGVAQLKGQ